MKAKINERIFPFSISLLTHPKENKFFLISFIFLPFFLFPSSFHFQPVTKVMISGLSGYTAHDTDVKNAFLKGYASYDSSAFLGQVDLHLDNDANSALVYANQNNYQLVVRSYTGINSAIDDSAKKYPKVLLLMPAGSNGFNWVCNLDIPNSAVISTGAGLDKLVTGYKVEFFDIDPVTNSNLSSFSNGYIAGQIAFIANHLKITPQQARTIARKNASLGDQTTSYVQYGKINLAQAIETSTPPPATVISSFTGSVNKYLVTIKWNTSQEYNLKGWYLERADLSKKILGSKTAPWVSQRFVKGIGSSSTIQEYSCFDLNVFNGIVQYRLKQINLDDSFNYSDTLEVNTKTNALRKFFLGNFPNPFNPVTNIEFSVSEPGHYTLKVYNVVGQEVATLVENQLADGSYSVTFDATKLASGMYIYTLSGNNQFVSKKMILTK
jgi:hypothetical protein